MVVSSRTTECRTRSGAPVARGPSRLSAADEPRGARPGGSNLGHRGDLLRRGRIQYARRALRSSPHRGSGVPRTPVQGAALTLAGTSTSASPCAMTEGKPHEQRDRARRDRRRRGRRARSRTGVASGGRGAPVRRAHRSRAALLVPAGCGRGAVRARRGTPLRAVTRGDRGRRHLHARRADVGRCRPANRVPVERRDRRIRRAARCLRRRPDPGRPGSAHVSRAGGH